MTWAIGATILVLVGLLLRWILDLGPPGIPYARRVAHLGREREEIYQPIGQEIETRSAILGISLNDAIDERDRGQVEIAWRLVRLSLSEWSRLTESLDALNAIMGKHLDHASAALPRRPVVADRFKSQVMIDYARMHELFDQLVFRSKLRFQLHLRMLRRASETLTREFQTSYRYADRTQDRPPEVWQRLDNYFHDFDLIAKETLLSFRALLSCLPHSELDELAQDLKLIVRNGVRTSSGG